MTVDTLQVALSNLAERPLDAGRVQDLDLAARHAVRAVVAHAPLVAGMSH